MVCGFWFPSKHSLKSHKCEQLNRQTALIYTRLCNFICSVWNHSSMKVCSRTIQGSLGAYRQNNTIFSLVLPRLFEHIYWISLIEYSVGIHKLLLINIVNNIPSDKNWIYYRDRFTSSGINLCLNQLLLWVYITCKKRLVSLIYKNKVLIHLTEWEKTQQSP